LLKLFLAQYGEQTHLRISHFDLFIFLFSYAGAELWRYIVFLFRLGYFYCTRR